MSIYLTCCNNNGTKYLRLMRRVKRTKSDGTVYSGAESVLNIGPLRNFDGGDEEYFKKLKASFLKGEPLLDILKPYTEENNVKQIAPNTVSFNADNFTCTSQNYASIIINKFIDDLGFSQFIRLEKSRKDIGYDILTFFKTLVVGRIIEPRSKIATISSATDYYGMKKITNSEFNVYKLLDFIYENKFKLLKLMNSRVSSKIQRKTNIIYYDVTNFVFEIEGADEDKVDEKGEVTEKGIRKFGVEKQGRKMPIVQFGLFLDDNGFPLSCGMFPGNTLDQATLRPALKETVDNFDVDKFILVSDRGMYSGKNAIHLRNNEHGYIISKSLKKTAKKERKELLDNDGWVELNSTFKYKEVVVNRNNLDENGGRYSYKEKIVIYWSEKFYKKELYENRRFLEFLDKFIENPASYRLNTKSNKTMSRFFKKDAINKKTGELIDTNDIEILLDMDKVNEFRNLMGYYQIVTSEIDMPATEVISKYKGLTKIEDQFRVMKSTLDTQPIYLRNKERIEAHLLICTFSLMIIRLMMFNLNKESPSVTIDSWSNEMSIDSIVRVLRNMNVIKLPNDLFAFPAMESLQDDAEKLLGSINLNIENKLYNKRQIQELKKHIITF